MFKTLAVKNRVLLQYKIVDTIIEFPVTIRRSKWNPMLSMKVIINFSRLLLFCCKKNHRKLYISEPKRPIKISESTKKMNTGLIGVRKINHWFLWFDLWIIAKNSCFSSWHNPLNSNQRNVSVLVWETVEKSGFICRLPKKYFRAVTRHFHHFDYNFWSERFFF